MRYFFIMVIFFVFGQLHCSKKIKNDIEIYNYGSGNVIGHVDNYYHNSYGGGHFNNFYPYLNDSYDIKPVTDFPQDNYNPSAPLDENPLIQNANENHDTSEFDISVEEKNNDLPELYDQTMTFNISGNGNINLNNLWCNYLKIVTNIASDGSIKIRNEKVGKNDNNNIKTLPDLVQKRKSDNNFFQNFLGKSYNNVILNLTIQGDGDINIDTISHECIIEGLIESDDDIIINGCDTQKAQFKGDGEVKINGKKPNKKKEKNFSPKMTIKESGKTVVKVINNGKNNTENHGDVDIINHGIMGGIYGKGAKIYNSGIMLNNVKITGNGTINIGTGFDFSEVEKVFKNVVKFCKKNHTPIITIILTSTFIFLIALVYKKISHKGTTIYYKNHKIEASQNSLITMFQNGSLINIDNEIIIKSSRKEDKSDEK